ncbi:XrtY-associated glycosyltransferase XYAG1 [Daejeonella oryzae]|uniref:XrtY-associated glycosyltransferase XYAG1 n=1 Tax=Daejeonella oryzae TaxID=1122943 RepID=UPI0004792126|nr:glycosyltransferase [Daejeonella oryzae]
MKIFHINASYKPAYIYGGPTMSVSKLCEELIREGTDVEVLTTTANGQTELDVKPGLKIIVDGVPVTYFKRLTKDHSHFSPGLLLNLWKVLREKSRGKGKSSDNIVHVHAWWNLVSVGSCVLAVLLSKPVILSPRGTLSNYSFGNRKSFVKSLFHRIIGKSLLKQCHFHVSTEKEKQDILNIVSPKSIHVIPNFVKLDFTLRQVETSNQEPAIFQLIFLSRIEEKKGLDILFKALHDLPFSWQLTIAGTGRSDYITYLQELAFQLKITDRISWIGLQDHQQKFQLLADHDLMILPSHDESFGNVVIESLSVGTPVLVSSKVGLATYIEENNFGWVSPASDVQFRKSIIQANADVSRRQKIRQQAPTQIIKDYDDQLLLDRYISLYDQISTTSELKQLTSNTSSR